MRREEEVDGSCEGEERLQGEGAGAGNDDVEGFEEEKE